MLEVILGGAVETLRDRRLAHAADALGHPSGQAAGIRYAADQVLVKAGHHRRAFVLAGAALRPGGGSAIFDL